ncbi:hypothetical protein MRB53_041741 [Persea americana]|nr:hypothetical protein MRB53_041741 [Persea americana]
MNSVTRAKTTGLQWLPISRKSRDCSWSYNKANTSISSKDVSPILEIAAILKLLRLCHYRKSAFHSQLTASEGRLQQPTLDLLQGSDIQFHRHSRLDIALVKNLPIALIFLPAADIPTFVGEGRVDLGITGRDQVAEHEATVANTETSGVEEVMDLGFGKCSLQVQVPEKGDISEPSQLVGKNIVTSFTGLSALYFSRIEQGQKHRRNRQPENARGRSRHTGDEDEAQIRGRQRRGCVRSWRCRRYSGLSWCVGVRDVVRRLLIRLRVWRDDASSRAKGHIDCRHINSDPHQVETAVKPRAGSAYCVPTARSHHSTEICPVYIQCPQEQSRSSVQDHTRQAGADHKLSRGGRLGSSAGNGRKAKDCRGNGRLDKSWRRRYTGDDIRQYTDELMLVGSCSRHGI